MVISRKELMNFAIIIYTFSILISSNTGTLLVKGARVILFLTFVLYLISNRVIKKSSMTYIRWAVLFLLYCTIMANYAFSSSHAYESIITMLYVLIINSIIFMYICNQPDAITVILKSVVWGSIISNIYAYITHGLFVFILYRGADDIGNANIYGAHSAIGVVIAIYLLINKRITNRYKILYYIAIFSLLMFTVLSGSRKVYLYLIIPLALYYVLKNKSILKTVRNIIIVILSIFLLWYLLMSIPFFYNIIGKKIDMLISGLLGGSTDASTKTRMILIDFGIKKFKQNPIFGYGLGNFVVLHNAYDSNFAWYYAHNNYVELLVGCGLIGTIMYYSLYVRTLFIGIKKIIKQFDLQCSMMVGLLISLLICEYGQVSYYSAYLQLILMIVYFIISKKETIK